MKRLVILLLAVAAPFAVAEPYDNFDTWCGGGSDNFTSTDENWESGSAPDVTANDLLAVFATGDAHAVQTPFGAGCSSLVGWPLVYQARGELKAVLGGFDPSQRRGMKPDEMSFACPAALYAKMLACLEESALPRQAGQSLRTRTRASRSAWGEDA